MSEAIRKAMSALYEEYEKAAAMGPLALIRRRAEILLSPAREHYDITDAEREELERICVAPREEDDWWMDSTFEARVELDVLREEQAEMADDLHDAGWTVIPPPSWPKNWIWRRDLPKDD